MMSELCGVEFGPVQSMPLHELVGVDLEAVDRHAAGAAFVTLIIAPVADVPLTTAGIGAVPPGPTNVCGLTTENGEYGAPAPWPITRT